jgi:hypothetical protein
MSQLEEQNREIDQHENQCISEVMGSKNSSVGARPGACDCISMNPPGGEQGRKLLACKAEAKRKREELSARARATYVDSAQRGQAARQPQKWPQRRSGQKPPENDRRAPERAKTAARAQQEAIRTVIALICDRFGALAIGLGEDGIRFVSVCERRAHSA